MKLEVLEIGEYDWYKLLGDDGKEREVQLQFFDLPKKPESGDTIEMNDLLFDKNYEGFSRSYVFGALSGEYGKKIESFTDVDCIMVTLDGEEIFLKRFYG